MAKFIGRKVYINKFIHQVSNHQIWQAIFCIILLYVLKNTQHFGQQIRQQQGSWRVYGAEH